MRGVAVAGLLVIMSLSQIGCESSCESLAKTICECEPNRAEENACLEAVRAAQNAQPEPTPDDLAICETRLDTCTCAALEDGDLAACGLAK